MISGMRKPSPISISSPRETTTSPPAASSFSARKMAAALLLTAMPGAPSSRSSRRAVCTSRLPRRPAARSYSRLEYPGRVDGAQRRASQVGMQHHPGGVYHAPQRRPFERRQRPLDARFHGGSVVRRPDFARISSSARRFPPHQRGGNRARAGKRRSSTSCTAGNSRSFSFRHNSMVHWKRRGVAQPG